MAGIGPITTEVMLRASIAQASLLWLAARYPFVEKSILVVTEGFREQMPHFWPLRPTARSLGYEGKSASNAVPL
jgi:hypothetical protein